MTHIKFVPILLVVSTAYTYSQGYPVTPPSPTVKPVLVSRLQTIGIEPGSQPTTVDSEAAYFEAPNWTRDGKTLLFDEAGRIMRISIDGGSPAPVDIGSATKCSGSHGLSPDGTLLAISCSTPTSPGSRIYILPSSGGTPRVVTANPGAYWHSWAPDGKTLIFTRPGQGSFNIFSIGVDGEGETALTGRIPVNTSGGLLAKGHPIGATGVAQITECWWQLRGEAGERQIETRNGYALQHNAGGRGSGVAVVNILTNRNNGS